MLKSYRFLLYVCELGIWTNANKHPLSLFFFKDKKQSNDICNVLWGNGKYNGVSKVQKTDTESAILGKWLEKALPGGDFFFSRY